MITVQSNLVLGPHTIAEVRYVRGEAWVVIRSDNGSSVNIKPATEWGADQIAGAINKAAVELPIPLPRISNS